MNTFIKFFKHLHTINTHRRYVRHYCFKVGLYKQGLIHDVSKYSLTEFVPSVKYFQGYRSPITAEKEEKGYSECWLHHKGRNKHHWEYWTDRHHGEIINYEMPFNYLLESVCDKLAASKVYQKENFVKEYPYEFFNKSYEIHVMHPENARKIKYLLEYYKDNGEEKALKYYKNLLKEYKTTNKVSI